MRVNLDISHLLILAPTPARPRVERGGALAHVMVAALGLPGSWAWLRSRPTPCHKRRSGGVTDAGSALSSMVRGCPFSGMTWTMKAQIARALRIQLVDASSVSNAAACPALVRSWTRNLCGALAQSLLVACPVCASLDEEPLKESCPRRARKRRAMRAIDRRHRRIYYWERPWLHPLAFGPGPLQ